MSKRIVPHRCSRQWYSKMVCVALVQVHTHGASLSDLMQKACPVHDMSDTSIVPRDSSGYVCEY